MLARNILLAVGVLALVVGLWISFVWYRQPAGLNEATKPVAMQAILVASHRLPASTILRPGDMMWNEVPAGEVVGADIVRGRTSETDFVGSVVRRPFKEHEPLTPTALLKPSDRGFIAATLAPGHRAMAVAVNAEQVMSGLILPGDHVDVILAQNFTMQGTVLPRKSVAETVLRNLRVIAVDQTFDPNAKTAEPKLAVGPSEFRVPKTVTLEVTAGQAQALIVADQLGKVLLALRGEAEATAVAAPSEPTWAADVSSALATSAPPAAERAMIEVLHGAKVERRCPTSAGLVTCQ